MAISNNGMQFQNNPNHQFIDLTNFTGSGEVGRYKDEVTGVLVGIEPRGGSYQVKDRRTGQLITRPNSWTAYFEDGSMWSWPTYVDPNTGRIMPWSRFDSSINLAEVVARRQVIHVWKDDKQFSHLEVVDTTVQMNPTNPMPIMQAPVQQQSVSDQVPWEVYAN